MNMKEGLSLEKGSLALKKGSRPKHHFTFFFLSWQLSYLFQHLVEKSYCLYGNCKPFTIDNSFVRKYRRMTFLDTFTRWQDTAQGNIKMHKCLCGYRDIYKRETHHLSIIREAFLENAIQKYWRQCTSTVAWKFLFAQHSIMVLVKVQILTCRVNKQSAHWLVLWWRFQTKRENPL